MGCLALVMISVTGLKAQEKHTFYVGYGLETHESFGNFMAGLSTYMATIGNLNMNVKGYSGAFFGGYRVSLSDRFEVGMMIAYERMKGNIRIFDETFRVNQHIYALMADVRYNYIKRPGFRLYSGAATGLSIHSMRIHDEFNERETELEEAFHVDALGVSYGKSFAPFVALGWGYKGVLNVGIQARF